MMTTSDIDHALKTLNIEVRHIATAVLYPTHRYISNQACIRSLGARTAVVSKGPTSFGSSRLCRGRRGDRF